MALKKGNWEEKEKRAEQARAHTQRMEEQYKDQIRDSIKRTTLYDVNFTSKKDFVRTTEILVSDLDSVSAIKEYKRADKRTAVLNFASFKNPGGMFINGSKAQEESLCFESFLYNVLVEMTAYYEWNKQNKNRALYKNRGLYSPDVLFFKDGLALPCDVITCAAPNKSAARRYQKVTKEENTEVLRSRIRFVLDIAKEQEVDILILGAFGCGVFGQDAAEVAEIFKEYLTTTHRCFEQVIFAVPRGKDKNYDKMKESFFP